MEHPSHVMCFPQPLAPQSRILHLARMVLELIGDRKCLDHIVWDVSEGHNLIIPDCQIFLIDYFGAVKEDHVYYDHVRS